MSTKATLAADQEKGGLQRDPDTLSSHDFNQGRLDQALKLEVDAELQSETLEVTVSLENAGAGHHLPTGSPMRHMLLTVEASSNREKPLEQRAGGVVPVWVSEPYRGLPGKAYAKTLVEIPSYRNESATHFKRVYPAPFWRPTTVESDTRIAAKDKDVTRYVFGTDGHGELIVKVTLTYFSHLGGWLGLPELAPVTIASVERRLEGGQKQ